MESHIFISYSREDQHRAHAITDGLKGEGLQVWWDSNLRAGESYDEVTEKHLREAGAVVVLWSQKSATSKWVRAEATVGERFSKLVPVMIEECERPLRFELVQTADLTRWHGDRSDPIWRNFIQAVKTALGHRETIVSAPAAAQTSSGDITIENTFWTSIKDGSELSDFEAYLKRYPEGHFADLARNRMAAIDRAQQSRKTAAPSPTAATRGSAAPPTQRPAQSHPAPPQQSVQARPATQQRPQQTASRQSKPQKPKSSGFSIVSLIGIGVIAIAIGGYFAMKEFAPTSSDQTVAIAAPETATDSVSSIINASPEFDKTIIQTAVVDEVPEEIGPKDVQPPLDADAIENEIDDAETAPVDNSVRMESDGDVAVEVAESAPPQLASGDTFTDCDVCPIMVVVPSGVFLMGSPKEEAGRFPYEGPQHEVSVASFAIGKHEVTFDQWQACVEDGGCGGYRPGDAGFGRESRPALYISWQDAKKYVNWISNKTGRTYRLPTESEWEYAARGDATSAYWWGSHFDLSKAAVGKTVQVGALPPNGFGLHEILGNAGEWVEDCYVNNFSETPNDGSAAMAGDCGRRVVRGGSWRGEPRELRSANRSRITASIRDRGLGFRVAAEIE